MSRFIAKTSLSPKNQITYVDVVASMESFNALYDSAWQSNPFTNVPELVVSTEGRVGDIIIAILNAIKKFFTETINPIHYLSRKRAENLEKKSPTIEYLEIPDFKTILINQGGMMGFSTYAPRMIHFTNEVNVVIKRLVNNLGTVYDAMRNGDVEVRLPDVPINKLSEYVDIQPNGDKITVSRSPNAPTIILKNTSSKSITNLVEGVKPPDDVKRALDRSVNIGKEIETLKLKPEQDKLKDLSDSIISQLGKLTAGVMALVYSEVDLLLSKISSNLEK